LIAKSIKKESGKTAWEIEQMITEITSFCNNFLLRLSSSKNTFLKDKFP
jgi:hypothetical protein